MKALKAFIKPFEVPQRSVKIKICYFFVSVQLSEIQGAGRVKVRTKYTFEFQTAEFILAIIHLFKVSNRNTRKRCKICSKLTITPEQSC